MYNQSHSFAYDGLNCFHELLFPEFTSFAVSAVLREYLLIATPHLMETALVKNVHRKVKGEKEQKCLCLVFF